MKRLAPVLILASLFLAGLSLAPTAASAAQRAAPASAAMVLDSLRGPLGVAKPARPPQSLIPARAAIASPLAPPPVTPDSCRLACAHTYYFCLASDNPDQCSQEWISCRIPCTLTAGPGSGPVGARP